VGIISVRVEKSGRILLPVAIRRRLGLKDGESHLLLNVDETPVGVTTRAQGLARAQAILSKYGSASERWSEELLAERRDEQRREDVE
jgi:bifunctional DNA-binding transcriptional regulator/antitoxin component of YhaV-PrlF toxin-antitoxin module